MTVRTSWNRRTHKEFLEVIYKLVGEEYKVLSEYKTAHVKVMMEHKKCGHIYNVSPSNFIIGSRCQKCNVKKSRPRKTNEEFVDEVYKLKGNEYVVLSEYKTALVKVKVKHVSCGHEWLVSPNHFTSKNSGCPKCSVKVIANKIKKTHEEFLGEVITLEGDNYKVMELYKGAKTRIGMQHKKCNRISSLYPDKFLSEGARCLYCHSSRGEQLIERHLDASSYQYETQYIIPGCKNERVLPFDFGVFRDGYLMALIEYEGIQHFEIVEFFGGKDGFERVRKNDRIKRNYCLDNDIKLIEIPYWDIENISGILNKELQV